MRALLLQRAIAVAEIVGLYLYLLWINRQVTGLDIVRGLRTDPDHDQMRLFVMTARQSESILKEARSFSIDDVITKPIDTQALVYRIRALL